MGYTTQFNGVLKFTADVTLKDVGFLKENILGQDCRENPDWGRIDLTYIDLELTDDMSGLQWDGSEKTYDLDEKVNLLISLMKTSNPSFGLEGELLAQGEDFEDRWVLKIVDGKAVKQKLVITGQIIKCPECDHKFQLENQGD